MGDEVKGHHMLCFCPFFASTTVKLYLSSMLRRYTAMRILLPLLVLLAVLALLPGCQRPENFSTSGIVGTSADTVRFDTLFTTQQSPTKRLLLYNRTGKPLRIGAVYVGGGDASPFRLKLNGRTGQRHENVELAEGDSLYCYLSTRIATNTNTTYEDALLIETDGETQQVPIRAHVLDAYLLRDTVWDCNIALPTDKPIVVDGILQVAEGCQLTINAGTQLYFTARQDANYNFDSQIQVLGTLVVQGSVGSPVLMTNFRLGTTFGIDWQETAGQWGGIHLTQYSQSNEIRHLQLKNASIGIRVDSASTNGAPKLLLQESEIRNCSNFAILGLGASPAVPSAPSILARNVLAYNCGQSVVGLYFGGFYRFENCTFADYNQVLNSGQQPAVAVSNYLSYQDEQGGAVNTSYPTQAEFANCILWGSLDNEFGTDFKDFGGGSVTLGFSHCILRAEVFDTGNTTNRFNTDPLFKDLATRNYMPQPGSPAIDNADPTTATPWDLKERMPAGTGRDIGAVEYTP